MDEVELHGIQLHTCGLAASWQVVVMPALRAELHASTMQAKQQVQHVSGLQMPSGNLGEQFCLSAGPHMCDLYKSIYNLYTIRASVRISLIQASLIAASLGIICRNMSKGLAIIKKVLCCLAYRQRKIVKVA